MSTKGYWIAHNIVTDVEAYRAYQAANGAVFERYGARFLVRGGTQENPEGQWNDRTVVIEFPSYEDALACYHSDEYQAAKTLRDPVSRGNLVIVEGYAG